MVKVKGWQGAFTKCIPAFRVLFQDGFIAYKAGWDDPVDQDAMVILTPGLKLLQDAIPDHNGCWSTFVKALVHMQVRTALATKI